jgi:hypothetical protein
MAAQIEQLGSVAGKCSRGRLCDIHDARDILFGSDRKQALATVL